MTPIEHGCVAAGPRPDEALEHPLGPGGEPAWKTVYQLTPGEADLLRSAALVPADLRVQLFEAHVEKVGGKAFLKMMSEFVGAMNSMAENCRDVASLHAITELGMHPHQAEKLNMPSVAGVMSGVILAAGADPKALCAGCAYRQGSVANQCFPTTCDAKDCRENGTEFHCHEDLDAGGNPTHVCFGHASATKRDALLAIQDNPFADPLLDQKPIEMVLHCPQCGLQHIDGPEWVNFLDDGIPTSLPSWTDRAHRSHICRPLDGGCGYQWRPADVATRGVAATATRGERDGVLPGASAPVATHRHLKTGGLYSKVLEAKMEKDLSPVTVYVSCKDREAYVRPTGEFADGRFAEVKPATLSEVWHEQN